MTSPATTPTTVTYRVTLTRERFRGRECIVARDTNHDWRAYGDAPNTPMTTQELAEYLFHREEIAATGVDERGRVFVGVKRGETSERWAKHPAGLCSQLDDEKRGGNVSRIFLNPGLSYFRRRLYFSGRRGESAPQQPQERRKRTMTTTVKALGEFGWNGKTYIVLDIEGAKRYWDRLDDADGPETDSLLARLKNIGALRQVGDNLNIVTLDEAKELGRQDAMNAVNESGETQTPDGGWDNWLIQGVGLRGVCQLLGEPESEQEGGWSEAMKAKLAAYDQGANEATRKIAGDSI